MTRPGARVGSWNSLCKYLLLTSSCSRTTLMSFSLVPSTMRIRLSKKRSSSNNPCPRAENPRYHHLRLSRASPSSETKGEFHRPFLFSLSDIDHVQFVSFIPLPSLRRWAWGTWCFSSSPLSVMWTDNLAAANATRSNDRSAWSTRVETRPRDLCLWHGHSGVTLKIEERASRSAAGIQSTSMVSLFKAFADNVCSVTLGPSVPSSSSAFNYYRNCHRGRNGNPYCHPHAAPH